MKNEKRLELNRLLIYIHNLLLTIDELKREKDGLLENYKNTQLQCNKLL